MPTILYHSSPLVYLRTKKTGSHAVKWCMKQYAEQNQVSILEVRSKDTDRLDTHKFVSHMPAKDLSKRLDVWDSAYKFTFIRNPWKVIYSYYNYIKYTLPTYNYQVQESYCLNNLNDFVLSLQDVHGTTNFNKEIYTIDNQVCADVFDVSSISSVMKKLFNVDNVPYQNTQEYNLNITEFTSAVDNYIYNDYEWEINEFAYTKPTLD